VVWWFLGLMGGFVALCCGCEEPAWSLIEQDEARLGFTTAAHDPSMLLLATTAPTRHPSALLPSLPCMAWHGRGTCGVSANEAALCAMLPVY
jgi:hypothetical protein